MSTQMRRLECEVRGSSWSSSESPAVAGFAGTFAGHPSPDGPDLLSEMLGAMTIGPVAFRESHRDQSMGFYLGWFTQENDPKQVLVWNEAGDVGLLFRGEVYSGESKGTSSGATSRELEGVLKEYAARGARALERLNGWFCGVLLDLKRGQIAIFNDRYGIGRVFIHEDNGGLYFASEAKALLKILPKTRSFDPAGLGEFLSCGCPLENRTLFSGISLLPPGSVWICSNHPGVSISKGSFFDAAVWEGQDPLPEKDFYDEFKRVWSHILPRYFSAEQPTGLSLTGGIDSRMILACARNGQHQIPCFTFGGRYRDCADVRIARQAAEICGQPHHVLPIGADFLRDFPNLAESTVRISDGAMDVTGAIDLHVQSIAREISPIRVTGTNGGEIVRRLVAFKPMRQSLGAWHPDLQREVSNATETYRRVLDGHRLTFTAFKQAPWHMGAKFLVERAKLTLRMPYFDNDLVKLLYRAPAALAESQAPALRLIAEANEALGRLGTDRGVHAAPSLMNRAGHWFQQFTFKAEYAYDYGMPQWLARVDHCLAALRLERLWLGRHKFHHFRIFYRDELAPYVRDVLLDAQTLSRDILSKPAVREIVNGHTSGKRNHTLEIHRLLTVELIQRCLFEEL